MTHHRTHPLLHSVLRLSLILRAPEPPFSPAAGTAGDSGGSALSSSSVPQLKQTLKSPEGVSTPIRSPSESNSQNQDTVDDDLHVNIYRPPMSPEERERREKTERFIRVVLTTAEEQEWKDMVMAALRLGTLKEHHLDAVVRGVRLLKYDDDDANDDGSSNTAGSEKHPLEPQRISESSSTSRLPPRAPLTSRPHQTHGGSGDDDGSVQSRTFWRSTPSQRLHRARDIVTFCAEEGKAEDCHRFRVTDFTVHTVLVQMLQAAHRRAGWLERVKEAAVQHTTTTAAASSVPPSSSSAHHDVPDALPLALYRDVWAFLAWMELHGYHVQSDAVLSELEAVVDQDEGEEGLPRSIVDDVIRVHTLQRRRGQSNASRSSSSLASSLGPSPRYAVMSRRVNRLEYLRGEREWFQEEAARQAQENQRSEREQAARRGRRSAPLPRTDPDPR